MPVEEQLQWCRERLGFEAMGIIALDSSLLNVRGVAFVLPYTAQPGHRTGDRIYSNGMLVADSDDQLVPSWAFFCRAVVDSGDLPLTASREALLESNSKSFVSERLGARLLSELIMVQGMAPDVYQDIIRLHSAGLKSLAVQGPDMLSLLRTSLPLTTTMGKFTLDDLIRQGDDLAYVSDAGAYAALEEVAVHADALVIDASGPHDQALLERINKTEQQRFREVDADHIVHLAKPENHPDSAAADRVAWLGAEALAEHRINVQVALFKPDTRPAMWWSAAEARGMDNASATLILNGNHPVVARLMEDETAPVAETVHALYVVGLLMAGHSVTQDQTRILSEAVSTLSLRALANSNLAHPVTGRPRSTMLLGARST